MTLKNKDLQKEFPDKGDYKPPIDSDKNLSMGSFGEYANDVLEGFKPGNKEDLKSLAMHLSPESPRDNRSVARAILWSLNAPQDVWEFVLPCIDSGYYKIADGMSFIFWRNTPISQRAGFAEDLATWAHDYAYYTGRNKRNADWLFYKTMRLLQMPLLRASIIYGGVRLFGANSWRDHEARRATIPGYGTDAWIEKAAASKYLK